MSALVFLSLCQIKNACRAGLRNPAVWIPVLLIALLSPTQVGSMLMTQNALPPEAGQSLARHLEGVHALVFLSLALLAVGYIDSGVAGACLGGTLKFTQADAAQVFPAPFPRRLVLLVRLPSATSQNLLVALFLAFSFRTFVWIPLEKMQPHGSGWPALAALLLCVGGFLNLAVALDVVLSLGRSPWLVRGFRLAAFLLMAALTRYLWTHGWNGLDMVARSGWMRAVFYPCFVAANAVMAPLKSVQLSGASWVLLFGWYGCSEPPDYSGESPDCWVLLKGLPCAASWLASLS